MNKFSRKAFQRLATRSSLVLTQRMGIMTLNKPATQYRALVSIGGVRRFASLPEHIKLEMPNLSPTMEKVNTHGSQICYRVTLKLGISKWETKCPLEMSSAALRPTKRLLTTRCKRRAISPKFCLRRALRTFCLARLSLFSLMTKKISQLFKTTQQTLVLLPPLLLFRVSQKKQQKQRHRNLTPTTSFWRCLTCRPQWKR